MARTTSASNTSTPPDVVRRFSVAGERPRSLPGSTVSDVFPRWRDQHRAAQHGRCDPSDCVGTGTASPRARPDRPWYRTRREQQGRRPARRSPRRWRAPGGRQSPSPGAGRDGPGGLRPVQVSVTPQTGEDDTLRNWVAQAGIDGGTRPGTSTDDDRACRAGARGPRAAPANETLKSALAFLRGGARRPTSALTTCIDENKNDLGVDPICLALTAAGAEIAPRTHYAPHAQPPAARTWLMNSSRARSAGCTRQTSTSTASARSGRPRTGKALRSPPAASSGSCASCT
jgi:hypothetical protein